MPLIICGENRERRQVRRLSVMKTVVAHRP